jgi:hypothetical protein
MPFEPGNHAKSLPALSPTNQKRLASVMLTYRELMRRGMSKDEACVQIADQHQTTPVAIEKIIDRFSPTTSLAQDYFRANALRMAVRVVRKANVAEAVDVLSRPNIGVLAPKAGDGSTGPSGFFLSVQSDTCGALKISTGVVADGIPVRRSDSTDPHGLPWNFYKETENEHVEQQNGEGEGGLRPSHPIRGPDTAGPTEPDPVASRPYQSRLDEHRPEPESGSQPRVQSQLQSQISECRDRLRAVQISQRSRERDQRAAQAAKKESAHRLVQESGGAEPGFGQFEDEDGE